MTHPPLPQQLRKAQHGICLGPSIAKGYLPTQEVSHYHHYDQV